MYRTVRIGFAVLLALVALQVSTRKASAQDAPPMSIYIAPTGLADHGTATVSGAVLFPQGDYEDLVVVAVQITQRINGKTTQQQVAFNGTLAFYTTSLPWSLTVVPDSGGFKAGYATVDVIAISLNYGTQVESTRNVLLRPR
jgi:hypothetical protein